MSLDQAELIAMGERGRAYYERHFSAAAGLNELEQMLNGALAMSRRG
jgi:hypothetical protein